MNEKTIHTGKTYEWLSPEDIDTDKLKRIEYRYETVPSDWKVFDVQDSDVEEVRVENNPDAGGFSMNISLSDGEGVFEPNVNYVRGYYEDDSTEVILRIKE